MNYGSFMIKKQLKAWVKLDFHFLSSLHVIKRLGFWLDELGTWSQLQRSIRWVP